MEDNVVDRIFGDFKVSSPEERSQQEMERLTPQLETFLIPLLKQIQSEPRGRIQIESPFSEKVTNIIQAKFIKRGVTCTISVTLHDYGDKEVSLHISW